MSLEQGKARLPGGWCILASTGGFLVGVVLALVVARLTGVREAFRAAGEGSRFFVIGLVWASAGIILGAVMGLGQWLVLRHRIEGAGWWILASTLGFGLGNGIGAIVRFCLVEFFPFYCTPYWVPICPIPIEELWRWACAGAACGLILGTAQWLVLRRAVRRAGWWIPANVVSWAAAAFLGEYAGEIIWRIFGDGLCTGLFDFVGGLGLFLSYLVLNVSSWEGLLVAGVVASAVTGLVLAWLLKRPMHEGEVAPAR